MDETTSSSVYLGDPRLAAHATSATPVWLWSADGSRILWANPAATAALAAPGSQALLERRFAIGDPARGHIERLAESLPEEGGARLFRLRGFAGAAWTSLTCSCSRLAFGRMAGILVVAAEPVATELPLAERVRRLGFGDDAVAAFSPDGAKLFATASAERRLAGASRLDVASLAAAALATGSAEGISGVGPVVLQRIGRGASTVLLVRFSEAAAAAAETIPAASATTAPQPTRPPPAAPGAAAAAQEAAARPERRRHPLRFVWQIDAAGRFFLESEEFADLLGAGARDLSGRPWPDINAQFGIDPEDHVARAIASRETWSNVAVSWPAGGSERLKVELAGLPAFDRNRAFRGYRGFGVCRDVGEIERLAARRPTAAAAKGPAAPPRGPEAAPDASVVAAREWGAVIAPNVVRFPGTGPSVELRSFEASALGSPEQGAFHELARQLTVRLQATELASAPRTPPEPVFPEPVFPAPAPPEPADTAPVSVEAAPAEPAPVAPAEPMPAEFTLREPMPAAPARLERHPALRAELSVTPSSGRLAPSVQVPARGADHDAGAAFAADDGALLDRMPVGILVYRYEDVLFANRMFLVWTGYPDLPTLRAAGGLEVLFPDAGPNAFVHSGDDGRRLSLAARGGDRMPVEARLFAIHWNGESAFAALLLRSAADAQIRSLEAALGEAEALAQEAGALLDLVEDAVLVIDRAGAILSVHGGGQGFLGRGGRNLAGASFEILFAAEARAGAAAQLAAVMRDGGTASAVRMVLGGSGELRPMSVTIAPFGAGTRPERMSVVLHDAARGPERADVAPAAAFDAAAALGKLCHEARSPINAIVGFCDLMLEEAFGPVGIARYREYIRDIKKSGTEVMSRLVAAAELAEVMAGTARLSPVHVSLNEIVDRCVVAQQEAASVARVVVRTALSPGIEPVLADAAAVQSMVLNLLGHAVQTTPAGGQVIVSTGRAPDGDTVLRIRDSGEGLNEKTIAAALHAGERRPPDPWDASTFEVGTRGSGLALVGALAEANQARFTITSKPNQGSLFEVVFPAPAERSSSGQSSPREEIAARPVDGAR